MRGGRALPLLILLAASQGGAQEASDLPGRLVDAHMTVRTDAAGLRVELHYRLAPAPDTREIPVYVLPFADAEPAAPTAFVWEDPVPLELVASSTGLLEGTVRLPASTRSGDVVSLRIRYRVRGRPGQPGGEGGAVTTVPSGRFTRVPLVIVPWPPAEASPGTFTGRLLLPAGSRIEPGFPTEWTERESAASEASEEVGYGADLPVLPSFVSFTVYAAGSDAPPALPGWGVLLAASAVLTLLALGGARARR